MKIVSYNINGIRAAVRKGLGDWIGETDYDIVCFQELKAKEEEIDKDIFDNLGYHQYYHSAEKKGYSGVGIITKIKPNKVEFGSGNEIFDREGRTIIAYFDEVTIVNTYFPSGSSGEDRQKFKYDFLDYYYDFINSLKSSNPNLIVVGDYNICHKSEDIHDPIRNKNSSGFLPEERVWMDKWFDNDMVDSYRHIHPDKRDVYSWWTYRAGARPNNKGWRIDYISVSKSISKKIIDADILTTIEHSDHCPIYLEIALDKG